MGTLFGEKMKNWKSFLDLFKELNKKCNYIVMRNYEQLLDDENFGEHSDIDFLCDDANLFIEVIGGVFQGDNIHGRIIVDNKEIMVDIRTVGDSYYDEKWEKNMLETRQLFKETIYVMNPIDYFYTLIYHEIYHKNEFRKDYEVKLRSIAKIQNINFKIDELKDSLDKYMSDNNYEETGYRSK